MTKHPEFFAALAARFDPREVKQKTETSKRTGKSFTCDFVTARTVMNRLDSVCGPEGWWDDYQLLSDSSVMCRLSICLPSGEVITKVDAGGCAGMADAGDDDKSGFSDAFKRAAVKFGVGRYLYQDGVAKLSPVSPPEATPVKPPAAREPAPPQSQPVPAAAASAEALYDYVKRSGLLKELRKIQERLGYPAVVREWSQDQVRTAFDRLPSTVTA